MKIGKIHLNRLICLLDNTKHCIKMPDWLVSNYLQQYFVEKVFSCYLAEAIPSKLPPEKKTLLPYLH